MKIVYLHQYFVTPDEYGATRSYWFSKNLIDKGVEVTVISSLSSMTKRKPGTHYIDGIKVVYVGGRYSNVQSRSKKIILFLRYFFAAIFTVFKEKKIDLIYATSTPLTVGAIALIIKKIKRIRYIFEVRDLWPEFPIQIGAISNSMAIGFLKLMEKKIYQNSIHIVALSPGMKRGVIQAGILSEKVTVIPNMSKPDLFYPRKKNEKIMLEYGIDPKYFNIIHFGSMGVANGLEYIIETATILKEQSIEDVRFIFAGYGQTELKLKKMVKERDLKTVFFLGKHNTFIMSDLVNCCDASMVSFKNLEILYTNSPNKLFDSLSAGKPIIVNSGGWTKELVEDNNCGVYVNPDEPKDFANKIELIKRDKNNLLKMGENSRKLSIEVFDKNLLCESFSQIILSNIKN